MESRASARRYHEQCLLCRMHPRQAQEHACRTQGSREKTSIGPPAISHVRRSTLMSIFVRHDTWLSGTCFPYLCHVDRVSKNHSGRLLLLWWIPHVCQHWLNSAGSSESKVHTSVGLSPMYWSINLWKRARRVETVHEAFHSPSRGGRGV